MLEFANRYWSMPEEVAVGEELEVSDTIDPFGILRLGQGQGKHTTDNEVLYYERKAISEGNRYVEYPLICSFNIYP